MADETWTPSPDLPVVHSDLTRFGTAEWPLRASWLSQMMVCPWRKVMDMIFNTRDESGPAADTGSATHAAIAAWHQMGQDPASALRVMTERFGEYPLASLEEAASLFLLYSRDPRNREADVVAVERRIAFTLPPAPQDPTQEEIVIFGTIDQVRRAGGRLKVNDVKTSKLPGATLLRDHLYQLAAYSVGASTLFGEPVDPGALICPRGYKKGERPEDRPAGVFFEYAVTHEDCRVLLNGLRHVVAAVRNGEVWANGGAHCQWCAAGDPSVCVPRLARVVDPSTMRISLPLAPTERALRDEVARQAQAWHEEHGPAPLGFPEL